MTPLTVHVVGPPVPKARPRVTTVGGFARAYTPKTTADFEKRVAEECRRQLRLNRPLSGPVEVTMRFVLPVPTSWPKWKQQAAIVNDIVPTGTPDLDNLEKSVKDGMNGVVYEDDGQIVRQSAEKRYGQAPMVIVMIETLPMAPSQITKKSQFERATWRDQ